MTALPPTQNRPAPTPLAIPASQRSQLEQAAAKGSELGDRVARERGAAERSTLKAALLAELPGPPSGAAQTREVGVMRAIVASRSDGGVARARQLGVAGEGRMWFDLFDQLQDSAPLRDVRAGRAQLDRAMADARAISTAIKHQYTRPRPFNVDEQIVAVIRKPPGNTSYPSSHSARSFAAATVLGALWPSHAADLLHTAEEVAFSRVYGGVHFPSDVAAGALIGAAAGSAALANGARAAA